MNKFHNLHFPIFGLNTYVDFEFTLDKIFTTIKGQKFIVDDKSIKNLSYLSRLIELDSSKSYQRLKYDFTIRSMEELLKADCKVGIDNLGSIRYFNIKENFLYTDREIAKIRKNYFWFKNISYPFTVSLENIEEIFKSPEYYFGNLTYINKNWYLLGFSTEKTKKDEIWL